MPFKVSKSHDLLSTTSERNHKVGLVSITENIDYSRPEGMLFTQMLGAFAQYFSESLGKHVQKGIGERAEQGRHLGGIPFGYESCWNEGEKGDKQRVCDPEHPGGIHINPTEGPAVSEIFKRYTTGTATLSQLAGWMNGQGLRTRNMHKLLNANGELSTGPKLFTTASIRGILHNPFYAGNIIYKGKIVPGAHEAIITQDTFDHVQDLMKKNSGRSETLAVRPERQYLLKGIIRCAYCGLPMWSQTYTNGQRYYREHNASRSHGICPSKSGSIPCRIADEQIGNIIEAIELGPRWLEEVLAIVALKDEVERVKKQRLDIQAKLKRMAKAYIDNLFDENEYNRQKKLMELELESLRVPEASAAEEAGNLIKELPRLWKEANLEERRKLLLTMIDSVYYDAKESKSIVAIKPKAPFIPVFKVATTREGSGVTLINGRPPGPLTKGGEEDSRVLDREAMREAFARASHDEAAEGNQCLWWRRGRVELPVQKRPSLGYATGLAGV